MAITLDGTDGITTTGLTSTGIDDNATSTAVTIDASGNVGIGEANPVASKGGRALQVQDASGAEVIVGNSTEIIADNDFIGAYLFENGDASGATPHYAGMWSRAVSAFGEMDLRFSASRDKYEADTADMIIDRHGKVGIGTSSPGSQLHVAGGIRFSSSGADTNRWNVYWNGSTGDLIVVSSDARLKKDFDYAIEGIETVNKLKPVRFTWKENNKRQLGFAAQESFEADEHLAWHDTESDQWGLDGWEGYAAVLTKAIQEQQAMIEELKVKVAALEAN